MKKYIEKYFLLLIFIFAISLVNITSTKAEATKITNLPTTEAEINKAIPADLSTTKEAFDKIKKVFTVTVKRIPFDDFNFTYGKALIDAIHDTGLIPVRLTITPKAKAPDITKPALRVLYDKSVEEARKVFNQRIIALAAKAPTNLGATLHTAPAPGSLFEAIYKGAISGILGSNNISTKGIIKRARVGREIVNAKVIAVRKGPEIATDILLQLDGVESYVSGFEKLSGVKLSYAHIVDPAAKNAAFVAKENFKEGLAPNTKDQDDCPIDTTLFMDRLKAHPACRNLLKITVPTATTAEFSIPEATVLDPKATPTDNADAASDYNYKYKLDFSSILRIFGYIRSFTTYFDPDIAAVEDHYLYASDAIRDQLKISKYRVVVVDYFYKSTHNWPASEHVQAALATLPFDTYFCSGGDNPSTTSLLRVSGDEKSVYLTKEIATTAVDCDWKACRKDVKEDKTKPEEKYSAKCKEQCTSTDKNFAQFQEDNETVCDLFIASGTGGSN